MAKRIKGKGRKKIIKIPLLWQFCTWLGMIPVMGGCFYVLLRVNNVSFPIQAGQDTTPYFFSAVFSLLAPLLLLYYVYVIMEGIVQKRSAMDIAKDVGKDIALKGIGMAAGALLNSDGTTGSKSSSSENVSGGGGSFGGGGASSGF